MTLNTFPNVITQGWSVMKSPNWATRMQRSVSGRELRVSDYVNPIYTFTLTYEVLRDRWDVRDGPGHGPAYRQFGTIIYDELRTIWNFFIQQQGSAIPFQFYDPTDNTTRTDPAVPNQIYFATGDGMTTSFQLVSPLRAPVIPIAVGPMTPPGPALDVDTGVVTYGTAPGAGVAMTVDMTYNYKVRFATDALEAENFMYQLWAMKQLKLVSVVQ